MHGLPLTIELVHRRAWLRQEIQRYEDYFECFVDQYGAARQLAIMREELAVLDGTRGGSSSSAEPPRYDLKPAEAAELIGLSKRQLLDHVERTPPEHRPFIDKSSGGSRRHLRFDRAQLTTWAEEKLWQASDPTPEAGSSACASPIQPDRPGVSSAPGSAPTPRPRPRSTGRKRRKRSALASAGVPLTGDLDLDGLV